MLPSKILTPEQAEAILAPLCCAQLNIRLNEQAREQAESFRWLNVYGNFIFLNSSNIVSQIDS